MAMLMMVMLLTSWMVALLMIDDPYQTCSHHQQEDIRRPRSGRKAERNSQFLPGNISIASQLQITLVQIIYSSAKLLVTQVGEASDEERLPDDQEGLIWLICMICIYERLPDDQEGLVRYVLIDKTMIC